MISGVGTAWAETKSVDITPSQALNDGGVDPITIVCAKGDGTSNPAISSDQLRLYQAGKGKTTGNTITFSSEKTITSIEFTFANDMTADNGSFSEGSYDSETSTWSGSTNSVTLTVTGTTSGKRIYITAITVYYEDGGSDPSLEDSDLALTGSPISLSFDLYNNSSAQVINYTTSSTGAITVSASEYVKTAVDEENKTITVTPLKKTSGAVEITVSQAADGTYAAGSATFTVDITDSTPKTGAWVETTLDKLTSDDVFVIVGNNGDNYAMTNGNGTGSAPSAAAVTVENGELTSDVADNMKWNISGNATDGYTFYPDGSTTTWLYCTNTNNGVRVGTNDNKTFTINSNYLYHNGTSRYVGVYQSQDWRCYTSINSNISGQTFAFYKYEDNSAVKAPVIIVEETFVGSTTATITCATDGATIYYSFDNTNWTEYTEALTIIATTTIYAKAIKNDVESKVVSKTTTKVLPTPTVTISGDLTVDLNGKTSVEAGTLTAAVTYNEVAVEGATVTWSGNNDAVATIHATTGMVTILKRGEVTFTATYAGNDDFAEATATKTITVIDNKAPGSLANPYTVAEALENTPSSGNSETVYVTGVVTGFYDDVEDITKEKYHRYYISDEGENNQLLVYNGKGLDNEAFDSADDLMIGDVVKIVGQLTTYNGTKEFAKDNYIVSLTRKADPELSFAEAEFEVLTGASFDAPVLNNPHELTVTYASDNAEVATVDASTGAVTILGVEGTAVITASFAGNETYRAGEASYTISVVKYDAQLVIAQTEVSLNGGMEKAMTEFYTTESDGAVTYESTDETIAKVEDGVLKTLKVGTTTITVNVAASTNYQAASGSFELTVTALPDVAPAGSGRFVKVTATEDIVDGQYLIVNETAGVAFDGSLETLDAANDVTSVTISNGVIDATDKIIAKAFTIDVTNGTLKSASGYYIGVSSNNNGLKQTEDAETYTHSFEIDENDDAVITAIFDESTMSLRYNKASNQNRFRYYKNAGQEAIQLYRYEAGSAESFDIAISEAKWRTLVASVNMKFPAEVKAYIVTAKTSEKAQLNKVSAVKAGVPVLLNAEPGNYTLTVVTDEECANTEANLLKVSEQNTCENVYVLANKSNGVGFYQWTGGWMGAGRVYLPVGPEVGARGFLAFDEDGETTGISTIQNAEQGTKEIYNLNGQRVNQPAKGLYIVNGKKVFIK